MAVVIILGTVLAGACVLVWKLNRLNNRSDL